VAAHSPDWLLPRAGRIVIGTPDESRQMNKTLLPITLLALLCSAQAQAAEHVDLLVRDATVVDVVSGELRPHRTIVVRDGRILTIVDARKARQYEATKTVDAKGKYAIPGLWDMHVHFGGGEALIEENRNLLPLYLAHGITAVR
jgi:adenine deaminase